MPVARQLVLPMPEAPFIPEEDEPEFELCSDPTDTNVVDECAICTDPIQVRDSVNLTCSHVFHWTCIRQWRQVQAGRAQCPICRRRLQQVRTLVGIVHYYQGVLHQVQSRLLSVIDLTNEL